MSQDHDPLPGQDHAAKVLNIILNDEIVGPVPTEHRVRMCSDPHVLETSQWNKANFSQTRKRLLYEEVANRELLKRAGQQIVIHRLVRQFR